MSRVLLTGASGFIGQILLKRLLEYGYKIAAISRNSSFISHDLQVYYCNIENKQDILGVFSSFRPNYVIHNAAITNCKSPSVDLQSNVLPSVKLIEISCEFDVEKFIFASSGGAIYGEVPTPNRANENDLVDPVLAYALGKLTVERYLAAYSEAKGLQYHILRYSNVIGHVKVGEKLEFLIPKFIQKAAFGQPLEILGREQIGDDGLLRDYVHLNDVATTNLLALQGKIQERILNVCTGQEVSVLQIAQFINRYFKNPSEICFLEPRLGTIKRSVLDPTLLEQYIEPMSFETALADILNQI